MAYAKHIAGEAGPSNIDLLAIEVNAREIFT